MAKPPTGLTPAQQRERRSKIMAIGAGVIFVIVLVVQLPKLMHGSKQTTAVTAAPVASPGSSVVTAGPAAARVAALQETASSAPPTIDGVTGAPVATAALPTISATGQLTTFRLFRAKDPFHAQVENATTGSTAGSSATSSTSKKSGTTPGGSSAAVPTLGGTPLTGVGTPSTPATASAPAVKPPAGKTRTKTKTVTFKKPKPKPNPPNAALISTNGKQQLVAVGVSFPQKQPLFKLVKLTLKTRLVRIGVLGGSFAGGMPTLPMKAGQKLTLANETDGSRYVVKLIKLVYATPEELAALQQPATTSAAAAPAAPATTTTPAATTTAPAATTTTAGTTPTAPPAPATTTPSTSLTAAARKK